MYDLLLGGPGETRETLRDSIVLMKRLEPDCVGAASMTRAQVRAGCWRWAETLVPVGLVAVPLYFNIHAIYPFEPSKAVLVTVTATVLLGIVTIALVLGSTRPAAGRSTGGRLRDQWQRLSRPQQVLAVALVLYLGGQLLATATSLAPAVSWWGAAPRLQGTSQLLLRAAVIIFVAWRWRRADNAQLNRLTAVLFLGAVPIGLYAVAQRLHLDRIAWSADMSERVGSTFGNPIFLAAYAALLLPLALARFFEAWQVCRNTAQPPAGAWSGLWPAAGWLIAGQLPLVALVVGADRFTTTWWPILPALAAFGLVCVQVASLGVGPAVRCLGLASLVALQLVVLALALARGPLLAGLAAVALLVVLVLPRGHLRGLTRPLIAVLILGTLGLVALNVPHLPIDRLRQVPPLHRLSPLAVPEGTRTLQARFTAWQAGLQAWSTGPQAPWSAAGGRLQWHVFGWGPELFDLAYHQQVPPGETPIGSEPERWDRAHNVVVDLLVTSGLLGVGSWLLLVGACGWCGVVAVRHGPRPLLAAGLLAAVAGHLVELQTAFVTAASSLSVWTLAALLAVQAGRQHRQSDRPAPRTDPVPPAGAGPEVVAGSVAATTLFMGSVGGGWWPLAPYPTYLLSGAWFVGLTLLGAAPWPVKSQRRTGRTRRRVGVARLVAVGAVVLVTSALVAWHWRVLAADSYAKAGWHSTAPWPARAATLQRALQLAPTHELYSLLLGDVLLAVWHQSDCTTPVSPTPSADPTTLTWTDWHMLDRDSLAEVARRSFTRALALNGWRAETHAALGTLAAGQRCRDTA